MNAQDITEGMRVIDNNGTRGNVVAVAEDVLVKLNTYRGDNLWEDVVYALDYDEAATNAVAGPDDRDVVIGGVHYHHNGAVWVIA